MYIGISMRVGAYGADTNDSIGNQSGTRRDERLDWIGAGWGQVDR